MRKTTVGGQALIEGLLMMGPKNAAIAIRKPNGEIIVEKRPMPKKNLAGKIPIIRGAVGLFRQMVLGVKALMYSAEFVEIEDNNENKEEKTSKLEKFIEKIFGDKLKDVVVYFSVILSVFLSVVLFILLPNVVTGLLKFDRNSAGGILCYNLFEGFIRMLIFLSYLMLVSRMKDIKRVWEYHGAEHKTIHCYEHEKELTIDNVKMYSTKHPRCGTSFMFLVMVISILVFSLVGWGSVWVNILARLLLIPVVAGISYEILKFAGKRSEWPIMKLVNAPGLLFQLMTTREPDERQIEVAIAAFNAIDVDDAES